ncbi:MAG: RNA 2',3'-cyclic phosphodiesterase [Rhodospirillales bacterium]|jgi:2'-5' RNA ligase|nr:RNA 2',3'-cyclic phosphodiesterase [Rhodospirillales bacterium]
MLRLFVALTLPDDIRQQLAGLRHGLPGAKWVEPEALHLTLRFIGEVDGGVASDIDASLSQVRAPAFELAIGGLDCFEQAGRVHTLWAGVNPQPLLGHLRDKVESAIVRSGQPPERRKFKAHITLARFKAPADDRIGRYLERHHGFDAGPFTVEGFTLFRSHLLSGGAHYEALADYPLEGCAP